jgi:hypothetical protein
MTKESTTMSIDPNEFLNQSGVPSAKFPRPGSSTEGEVQAAEVTQQRDFDTGVPLTWDDGKPMMQIVITVATDERDPKRDDDNGLRKLYGKGNMLTAVRQAVQRSGAELRPGGWLKVTYTGDGEIKRRGKNPPKLYTAEYRPGPAAAVDALIAGDDEEPF